MNPIIQSVDHAERVDGDPMSAEAVRIAGCRVVMFVDAKDAEAFAAIRIDRGDRDLLADDCRPVAHAVADALVAAGMGRG